MPCTGERFSLHGLVGFAALSAYFSGQHAASRFPLLSGVVESSMDTIQRKEHSCSDFLAHVCAKVRAQFHIAKHSGSHDMFGSQGKVQHWNSSLAVFCFHCMLQWTHLHLKFYVA